VKKTDTHFTFTSLAGLPNDFQHRRRQSIQCTALSL